MHQNLLGGRAPLLGESIQRFSRSLTGFKARGKDSKQVEGRTKGSDGGEKAKESGGGMILPPAISESATVKLYYLQFKQFPFIDSLLFGQVR